MRRRIFVPGVAAMATGISDPAQGNQATPQDGQSPFALTLTPDATQILLEFGGLPVPPVIGPTRFGDSPVVRETGKDANTAYLDLVLYTGTAHPINLATINAATVGFGIQVGSVDGSPLKTVE
jgi:hypothetical protein